VGRTWIGASSREVVSLVRRNPHLELNSPSIKGLSYPCQQIRQSVCRQNHPPISNPARINNVAWRKHGSRRKHRAILIPTLRNPSFSYRNVGRIGRLTSHPRLTKPSCLLISSISRRRFFDRWLLGRWLLNRRLRLIFVWRRFGRLFFHCHNRYLCSSRQSDRSLNLRHSVWAKVRCQF
jgi:hypothetical protein